jgi:hypothetical protein
LDLLVDLETLVGLLLLHSMHQSWSYARVSCPHQEPSPAVGVPGAPLTAEVVETSSALTALTAEEVMELVT